MYISYITVHWSPPPSSQALCNTWMALINYKWNGKYNIINNSWHSFVTVGAIIALWKITEWTLLPVQLRKRIHGQTGIRCLCNLVTVQLRRPNFWTAKLRSPVCAISPIPPLHTTQLPVQTELCRPYCAILLPVCMGPKHCTRSPKQVMTTLEISPYKIQVKVKVKG